MKNVKRALSFVLVLALALSMCVLGAGAANYSDVSSTYAYSAEVQFLSDIEVITGYPDGTFKPDNTITRGEAAAVIFRTLAGKGSAAENYQGMTVFADVPAGHWACGYVNFCTEMGIVNGYPDGNFKPDQTVTYAEYVTMLARALGLDIGKDLSYPFGFIAEATIENVNYGVDLSANDPAPRGAVAKLTYNAIFDATYRRIANNIYTTTKPTIAKDVLKLETFEGVVTSVDDYDWASANAVGDGKIRVTDFDEDYSEEWDYDLDDTYLGKTVRVWYKPNEVTASGKKVYAVIEQPNNSVTLPHIVLKGVLSGDVGKAQITYALNDVDYKAKLEEDVVFVENNDYLYDGADNAQVFYPAALRMWLPVTYTFIDNDTNGKYDYVVRKVYGFGEVTNLNNSRIYLDTVTDNLSIDRTNDNNVAYAWNEGLEDVDVEDWVCYYADGAVSSDTSSSAIMYGPKFDDDGLYGDTNYAVFAKMDNETLEVEKILDHDRYIFDGTTFRTWSAHGSAYTDLVDGTDIQAEVGDEYDLWYTKQFGGIIASAESADNSTGNFIVVTAIGDEPQFANGNFDIQAIDAKGDEVEMTVKNNKNNGLNVYNAEAKRQSESALTWDAFDDIIGDKIAADGYALLEIKTNSNGLITEASAYILDTTAVTTSGEYKTYYNTRTGLLKTDAGSITVNDNSLVFVINEAKDSTKTYVGSFPKITGATAADVVGYKTKTSNDDTNVKALVAVIDSGSASSSDTENIVGYLREVSQEGDHFQYTIAYGDDAAASISSAIRSDKDLDALAADDDLITNADWTDHGRTAAMIMFDLDADEVISNMRWLDDFNTETNDDDSQFLSAFVVVKYNTKGSVTLRPIEDGVTPSGFVTDEDAVIDAANASDDVTFNLASDVSVFVFNPTSTNRANTRLGALGDLVKAATDGDGNIEEAMVVTIAFNGDDEEITAIFANKDTVKVD